MNEVHISGRAIADPKKFGNDTGAMFTVAVPRGNTDKADFIHCKIFGEEDAAYAYMHIEKGTKIEIKGTWHAEAYKSNGATRYSNELHIGELWIDGELYKRAEPKSKKPKKQEPESKDEQIVQEPEPESEPEAKKQEQEIIPEAEQSPENEPIVPEAEQSGPEREKAPEPMPSIFEIASGTDDDDDLPFDLS